MRLTYLEMLAALGADATPAQTEFAAVAFDSMAPSDRALWGADTLNIPSAARRIVGAVCGRGSGKSRFFGAYRLLHLALTVDVSRLPRGEDAVCPIVAPDLKTARHTLNFARGAAEILVPTWIEQSTADSFVIRRDGVRVRIAATAASGKGSTIRGRSMPGALLEECAFFRDKEHRVNDVEIFNALIPRIMHGGQLIMISTPWARSGLLYEYYSANFAKPKTAIIAHAPTLTMALGRDDYADIEAAVAAERVRDPDNARREYDAEFMSANAQAFFDSRAIERAICDAPIPHDPELGALVEFAGDFGFTRDSSALVGVARGVQLYDVVDLLELTPSEGALKPSETVATFADRVKAFGCDTLTSDVHYRESIREALATHSLYLMNAPEGARGKNEAYSIARSILHSDHARIPRAERFIRQLQQVEARPTSGGLLSISSPRWSGGGHGDLVSAWVLATWRAYKHGAPTRALPENPEKRAEFERDLRVDAAIARLKRRTDGEYDYGD